MVSALALAPACSASPPLSPTGEPTTDLSVKPEAARLEPQGAALRPGTRGELAVVYGGYGSAFSCLGRDQIVFCTRHGEAFGAKDGLVNVRIDVARGEVTVLGQAMLSESGNQLFDRGEVYAYYADALYRLPRTGARMEKVHSLPSVDWDAYAVHEGQVWLSVPTRVDGVDVWRFVGAKLGSTELLPQRTVPRFASDGLMVAGGGRLEFVRRSDATLVRLALNGQGATSVAVPGPFGRRDVVLLVEKDETFVLREHEDGEPLGWTLTAVGVDGSVRAVHQELFERDAMQWAPHQIVGDTKNLYFIGGREQNDSPVRVMQLPKAGGAPSVVGTFEEGGTLWVDGDYLFVAGGAGGTIYRTPLR